MWFRDAGAVHDALVAHPLFDIPDTELASLVLLSRDLAIGHAAAARDGVLTRCQLQAIGVSTSAIDRRVERGLLHQRHRGVFAVGRLDLTMRGRWRAALLACGRTAALARGTSASQRDLLRAGPRIEVVVAASGVRAANGSGIRLHRTREWRDGDIVIAGGLPCTSLARTLCDLASTSADGDFRRVWNAADSRGLLDPGQLRAELARRRPGVARLRERIEAYDVTPPTESELEELAVELFRTYGLPMPRCQWALGDGRRDGRVDFVWVEHQVALEVDGRRWHAIQEAHEADRARDLRLRTLGFDPHRYTYGQIRNEAAEVAEVLRRALGRNGRPSC